MTLRQPIAPARSRILRCLAGVLAVLALLAAGPAFAAPAYDTSPENSAGLPSGFDGSYSYVRVLEGSATLIQGGTGDREQVQVNQPILVGDRLWVAPRGRVEVVLSDRNLLRVDAGSEVVFDALAGSPDRNDPATILRVPQGNVQLVVVSDFLGEGLPRVDTPNATTYAADYGAFRITSDGGDWTEVVARDGAAEVVTRNGSLQIGRGEEAVVRGERDPVERVSRAGRLDSLETWGERLDREARYAAVPYVDDSIRYEAATLDRHGSWVTLDGRYAWRPRVGSDWRPYTHGRWSHSPLGYTWVSYEPWGWVPYHYGTWDHVPGYGWAWFPGTHFAPAWVYWYWTDAYVGWVPVGYYTHHYRSFFDVGFGFRYGVYGWASGHWNDYRYWNFCDLRYFGGGRQHHSVYRGDRFGDHVGHARPRRGILTTDTRGVPRLSGDVAAARGDQIVRVLAERGRPAKGDLPDMTGFVAREREIGQDVRERIAVTRGRGGDRDAAAILPDEVPRRIGDQGRGRDRTPAGARDTLERFDRGRRTDAVAGARARRPDDAGAREAGERRLQPKPGVVDREGDRPLARDERRGSAGDRSRSIDDLRRTLPNVRPRPQEGAGAAGREPSADRVREARPGGLRPSPSAGRRDPGDTGRSWREREPVRPERPSRVEIDRGRVDERSPTRRLPELDRSRRGRVDDGSGRTSVPRRVIEGVRSNDRRSGRSSTVERRESRPDRVRSTRERPTRERSTRERSGSPPPRTRSSSPPPRRSSSVSPRSSSRSRGASSSASSGARSSRSGSSSGRSGGAARSRGNDKPPL